MFLAVWHADAHAVERLEALSELAEPVAELLETLPEGADKAAAFDALDTILWRATRALTATTSH